MVRFGAKKVNSCLPFLFGPNSRGVANQTDHCQITLISIEPLTIFPKHLLPFYLAQTLGGGEPDRSLSNHTNHK